MSHHLNLVAITTVHPDFCDATEFFFDGHAITSAEYATIVNAAIERFIEED
jgi:hypothetical protein